MSWVSWIENTIILAVVAVNALYTLHCNSSVLLIPTLPSSQTNVIHPSEVTLRSTNTRARTCYVLVHLSTVATLAVSQMPSIAAAYFHNLVTCVFSTHLISPLSQGTIVVLVPFQHHARQTLLRPYETNVPCRPGTGASRNGMPVTRWNWRVGPNPSLEQVSQSHVWSAVVVRLVVRTVVQVRFRSDDYRSSRNAIRRVGRVGI
jgi:hypothetical protein